MKFKKIVFLFVFLVALLLVAWLLEHPRNTNQPTSLFPEFSPEAAALIDINNKGENVILAKTDQGWRVGQGFPADSKLLKKALESIKELKKAKNVVSKNPKNQTVYEVDPNHGIKVKVSDHNKKLLANFLVGKTGPDFMSTYLRKADSNEVLLCDGYHLRSAFSRMAKNWYDLNVCKFTPDQISKIEIAEANKKLTLKKDQGKWQLIDPNQAPAKKSLADDIANGLSRLHASDLLKSDKLAEYQLDHPKKQITVYLTDGSEKKINIGKENDKHQYYVKTDQDIVYLVSQYNIKKFNKTFEELREPPPKKEETKKDKPPSLAKPKVKSHVPSPVPPKKRAK